MHLLDALTAMFINTFGITRPTDETRRHATWFILGLLILMSVVVCAVGYAFYAALRH